MEASHVGSLVKLTPKISVQPQKMAKIKKGNNLHPAKSRLDNGVQYSLRFPKDKRDFFRKWVEKISSMMAKNEHNDT